MKVTTDGKDGGIFIGHLHSQGGEPAVVSSSLSKSGMPIEVEDGEAIVKRDAVSSDKVLKVEGRPCEIISEINQMFGGRKIPCDKVVYSKTKKGIFEKGGKIKSSEIDYIYKLQDEIARKYKINFHEGGGLVGLSLYATIKGKKFRISNHAVSDKWATTYGYPYYQIILSEYNKSEWDDEKNELYKKIESTLKEKDVYKNEKLEYSEKLFKKNNISIGKYKLQLKHSVIDVEIKKIEKGIAFVKWGDNEFKKIPLKFVYNWETPKTKIYKVLQNPTSYVETMAKGGKIKHYKEEKVRTGDYEIDISKIYREFGKNIVTVPVSLFETKTESENKINNIKIGDGDIVGIFTIVNKKPFLIDGNHRTEQLKRNKIEKGKYIYIPFNELFNYKEEIKKEKDDNANLTKQNDIMDKENIIEENKTNVPNDELPFGKTEVTSFGLGGTIQESDSFGNMTKITWDEIPEFDKFATNNKPVKWEAKPTDKGLVKIMKNFIANDEYRPMMHGVYFDDDYIVSTDSHRLIAIYSKNKKEYIDNTYELNSDVKIEGQYPNYLNVFSDEFKKEFVVDTDKFKMYVDILQRTKVGNRATELITFSIGNEKVGMKSSFLSDVLGAIQQLGYKQFLFRYSAPTRAMSFIPDISFKGKNAIGRTTILLLMPMIVDEKDVNNYSVWDLDFAQYIDSNYNFKKNLVVSDGKEYDLDPYEKSINDDVFSFKEFKYLTSFANKHNGLPIINRAIVKDNKFTVSDLETTITKKVKGLETGIYDLTGMMIFRGIKEMEDYPRLDKFGEFSDFANIPIDEMTTNLKYAIPCMAKDDYRLMLNGIYFEYENDELIIVSTDANSMFYNKFNHSDILTKENKYFLVQRGTIEVLNKIIKFTDGDNIKISVSKEYVKFIIGDYTIIGKLFDGKYVDFKKVLPNYLNEIGYKVTEITTGSKPNAEFEIKETDNIETPTSEFGLYVASFKSSPRKVLFKIFGKNKQLKTYKVTDTLHYVVPIDKTQTIDDSNITKRKERREKVSVSRKKEAERLEEIRKIENPTTQEKTESQSDRIQNLKEKYGKADVQLERIKSLKEKYSQDNIQSKKIKSLKEKYGNDNFDKWFGNSKIVDDNGNPLIVYHGTSHKYNNFRVSDKGDFGKGIYFSINKKDAEDYARIDSEMSKLKNQYVISAYLNLQNPLIVRNFEWKNTVFNSFYDKNDNMIDTTEVLKKRGYDGIIITPSGIEKPKIENIHEIIAFNPSQIRIIKIEQIGGKHKSSSKEKYAKGGKVSNEKVFKVKSFKTDEGDFDVYDIKKDVRGRGDMFTVLKDKNGWIVRNALVPDNLQKQGIATDFYRRMNDESIKHTGKPLRSTRKRKLLSGKIVHELSEDGIRLWDSLVKKGYAIKIGEKDYQFKNNKK